MNTVSTDDITKLRRLGQHAHAWSRLLHSLQFASDFPSSSHAIKLWFDHAVGRYGDTPSSQDKRQRQEPGFLLWPYFQERWRECLAQPTVEDQAGSLQRVSEELWQAEQVWLQAIERIDAYLASTRQQVRSQLSGHFAVCQTLLAAAQCVLDPTAPIHRFQKAVVTSLRHYHQARCSQSLPSQDVLCRKIRLPPPEYPSVTLNLEAFPKQLQSVWSLARREAQAFFGFSLALDQAVGMAQRATRWLLDQPCSAAAPAPVWQTLLLLEGPATSCAWLQLQAMPDDFGSLRAYPDPIQLGLLGFDARWQESMDDAIHAVSGTVHEDQPRAWCWSLRYANRQLARLLTRSRPDLEDFVQRPLEQAGSSASASLAVMLYRATRGLAWSEKVGLSAAVTNQGKLMPVRLSEKLQDSPLWQRYSSQRLKILLVAPDPNEEINRWHECLAATAHRHLELHTYDTVEEASRCISQWQQRQGRRRLFLRCGLALSLAPLTAAPWLWPQIHLSKSSSPANVRFVVTVYDRVRQEGALLSADHLPLHPGDEIRLEATADEPLYFYLFWINVDGTADPLWPWDRDWRKLDPRRDQPTARLSLPDPAGYWELTPDREGMQSVVLVASSIRQRFDQEEMRRLFFPVEQSATLRPMDRDRLIHLKNHQILRANDLSPVAQAARREAKDMVSVTGHGVEELFRQPNTEVQALCFPFVNTSR